MSSDVSGQATQTWIPPGLYSGDGIVGKRLLVARLLLNCRRLLVAAGLSASLEPEIGGPEGIRTLDLFHAMEARSQLRHRPPRRPTSPW